VGVGEERGQGGMGERGKEEKGREAFHHALPVVGGGGDRETTVLGAPTVWGGGK
jgi:hypothetical protein